MIRVVLDTNVIVSGTISTTGAPRAILDRWADGAFELVVSPALLAELAEVLRRSKIRRYVSAEDAEELVSWLRRDAVISDDEPVTVRVAPDPSDDFLIALARRSAASVLVSGDRALSGIRGIEPPILTPRAFLEALQ